MERIEGGSPIGMHAGAMVAALAVAVLLAGSARLVMAEQSAEQSAAQAAEPAARPAAAAANTKKATATIEARSGSKVTGMATFAEIRDRVHVTVEIAGATPGEHGVHIHEKGDCSAADASSAGPHFNPAGHSHGGPNAPMHHAGDFGNLTVGPDGKGKLTLVTHDISLKQGPRSVMGRAIVVHEMVDDLKSQPAGNAGARIGCGVIR